jgi:hypothetical protein
MNPRRLPIGVLMVIPIVLGFGLYAFTGQAQEVEDPNATSPTPVPTLDRFIDPRRSVDDAYADYFATQTAEAPPTLSPDDAYATQIAGQPTPTPPAASHGAFHDGAWVRVSTGSGDCLNARNQPTLNGDYVIVNVCIPDGYEGAISGYTQQAEGHWWWQLAGLGWVAEDYLVYVRDFDARSNVVDELSDIPGKVAFLRGNDVWVMEPDGSNQILLVDNEDSTTDRYIPSPTDITWSPDGSMIAYNVDQYDPQGTSTPTVDLHVVPLTGGSRVAQVYPSVAGGGWSPDSRHIGIVRDARAGEMGGGPEGIPAILDVTTGGQLVLGSDRFWQTEAPSFNYDGSLLMVHQAVYPSDGSPSSVAIVFYSPDGMLVDRLDFDSTTANYMSPQWSSTDNRVVMHVSRRQGDAYNAHLEIYDLATRAFSSSAELPKYSDRIGGRCGGGDMFLTAWSLDGQRVFYSFGDGDTGANGVWSWDVASGVQSVIYAAYPGGAAAGPQDLVMFSTGGMIEFGTTAGGFPRIITDGSSPVWWMPR